LDGLIDEMRTAGYPAVSRGVKSDRYQRYSDAEIRRLLSNNAATVRANGAEPARCPDCYRLLTLGHNPMSLHPGEYVGALAEVEFLSNPSVVEAFILRPDSLDIIARGFFQGIRRYFDEGQIP